MYHDIQFSHQLFKESQGYPSWEDWGWGKCKIYKDPTDRVWWGESWSTSFRLNSSPPLVINPVLCTARHDVLALPTLFWTSNPALPLLPMNLEFSEPRCRHIQIGLRIETVIETLWPVNSFSRWENQSSVGQEAAGCQELASKTVAWFYVHQLRCPGSRLLRPTTYAYCAPGSQAMPT